MVYFQVRKEKRGKLDDNGEESDSLYERKKKDSSCQTENY
jgi:hypothetical protein